MHRERREVAEEAEVLGQRARDDVAHDGHGRVEVADHALAAGRRREAEERERRVPDWKNRPSIPVDRSGKSSTRVRAPRLLPGQRGGDERPADREQVAQLVAGGVASRQDRAGRRSSDALADSARSRTTLGAVVISRWSSASVDPPRSDAHRQPRIGDHSSIGVAARARRAQGRRSARTRPSRRRSRRRPGARTRARRAASSTRVGSRRARRSTRLRRTTRDPGSVVAPSRSVTTPPREVVRGGRNGKPVARRIEPDRLRRSARSSGSDRGSRRSSSRRARGGRVRRRRACAWIARATTSRGARSASGCTSTMNATPFVVTEHGTFAAERLGEQRTRHRRVMQRGRVELHELEVGARDTPARIASAMPSPVDSVGLVVTAKQLADTTGRERSCRRARISIGAPSGPSARTPMQRPASTIRSTANQPSRTSMRSQCVDGGDERTLDLGAGRVTARVHHARDRVTTLAREQRAPPSRRRPCDRTRAPSAVSSRTRAGPSVTRTRTASTSHRPAPAASVSDEVQLGRVGLLERGRDTPCAYRVAESDSSPFVSTTTDNPRRAAWSAVERPAMPLPRTRTSATARAYGT